MLAGIEAMRDTAYFESCVQSVVRQRGETAAELRGLGFSMTDSRANFLFAAHPALTARGYYEALKARGVLIRCWDDPALREHVRITIGTREQMRPSRAGNPRHSVGKDDIMRSATIQRKTAETDHFPHPEPRRHGTERHPHRLRLSGPHAHPPCRPCPL